MEFAGSRTEKNLEVAFAGESQACNAYMYYAAAAKEAGHHPIANIFLEIAQNEGEHAKTHFESLGRIKDTRTNLELVAQSEKYEGTRRDCRKSRLDELCTFFMGHLTLPDLKTVDPGPFYEVVLCS